MADKYEQVFSGQWFRVPMRGYQNQCCHCGLIHDIDFRRGPAGSLETRVAVNARATAAVRRKKRKKQNGSQD